MSNSKPSSPKPTSPKPASGKNWPSKVFGKPSGKGRDDNGPKHKN